ncbi:MAG: hypothetical protein KFF50_04485 [Desulfatitalea sp.]|nr:hypothetical protein [Desulfatitalea sp.]
MGALAHYLETERVATTQISLIREHTATIQPPRALWVPFELGRPLGVPGDAALQRKVLVKTLELLEAPAGPLLLDWSEPYGPAGDQDASTPSVWACPITFSRPPEDQSELDRLIAACRSEVTELRPWYDLGLKTSGRTAVVRFEPEAAFDLLSQYAVKGEVAAESYDGPFAVALRLAAQDIKAFYFEAVASRPGGSPPDSAAFNRWIWHETALGQLLKAVKERCLSETDEALRQTGALLLVPLEQA